MSSCNLTSDFLGRFDHVVRSYRRATLLRAVSWGLLILLVAMSAVTAFDFFFELSRGVRVAASSAIIVVAAASLAWLSLRTLRKASDEAVAAELESHFPELGQAVRTSVEFRRPVADSGASDALVAAMQYDVARRSRDLPLHETVPKGELYRAATLFGAAVAVLVVLTATSWEWRMATLRMLFGDRPYTEVAVRPGNTRVDEGSSLQLAAEVRGRVDRPTTLMTRPLGGDENAWTSQELGEENIAEQAARQVVYQVALANVREPLEYRVAAGSYVTDTHRVDVRHPVEIKAIRVSLSPPTYTGLSETVVDEGNVHAVAGSQARFVITLDRPAETAELRITPQNRRGTGAADDEERVTLAVDGRKLTGEIELTQDVFYSIEGEAADGSHFRENRHRIRVREDRPPRIAFDEPPGETEVHSLAEMIMRARAEDDYGLARAGIVFQVNNGQEYPLIMREMENGPDAGEAPRDSRVGRVGEAHAANVTKVQLEKLLPLEHFELTQKDSITYYAFAEDNPPGGPRRVQTDYQFIDIRPFRRLYRAVEGGRGGGGGGGGGPQLASLEELISRERFVLNRTLRLARSSEPGERVNLDEVDQIIPQQQTTAELTRELADAVAEVEDEEGVTEERVSDLFYSAEEAMLAAMDSLTVGNYDTAALQERDALRYLIEGRNAVEVLIGGAGGGALSRLFRADRRLLQKLRRPKTDVEKAAEASRMLRNLADREGEVYDELAEMVGQAVPGAANEDESPDPEMSRGDRRRRRALEKKQLDITLDAERVDEVVQEVESMTELTRERSTQSTALASEVTGAMERGSTDDAADKAQTASALFRELAAQIDGVTAIEPVGRIGVARDLASRLAVESRTTQQDLSKTAESWKPGSTRPRSEMEAEQTRMASALSRRSAQWKDTTATIEDVLKSIVQTYSAEQDDAVGRIERLLAEAEFAQVTDHLQRLEDTAAKRDWRTVELELEALADRMDNLGQRLDAIHRSLVAPRVEQLRAFEARAAELRQALGTLSADEQITRWHQRASALLEDLASADVQLAAVDRLRKAMQAAGWNEAPPARWGWDTGENNSRIAPEEHAAATQALVSEIQRYIQELVVGGMYAADAEAVPPQYVPLVRRYMEALSQDGGD